MAGRGRGAVAPEVRVINEHTPQLQGQRKDPGLVVLFFGGGVRELVDGVLLNTCVIKFGNIFEFSDLFGSIPNVNILRGTSIAADRSKLSPCLHTLNPSLHTERF